MTHHAMSHSMSPEMQECIQICLETHRISTLTAHHCLSMGGEHAAPEHIGILLDNAQIALTSADFMLRNSRFHARTCTACAVINEACATECERIGPDPMMQQCIDQCRRCAESCRRMAEMA
ncbi:MAG: four-helix bundle copper-binding protein [Chloroflexota bacterium]|nr:four-helix bundle copper-binding protein [Chloroflexota bacterium]PLS77906.1 MAG: ferredoxin [Chloroflexota bacterium]